MSGTNIYVFQTHFDEVIRYRRTRTTKSAQQKSGCPEQASRFSLFAKRLLLFQAQLNQPLIQEFAGRDVGFLLGVVGRHEVG
jgi:hypothetical protein